MLILGAWQVTLLGILFILVCLFMLLVILIQKPRGGGLSGAFGGGGSAQAAFGAKTGDVLTWFTVVCFAAFLLLAISLTWLIKPSDAVDAPEILPAQTPAASTEAPAASENQEPPQARRADTAAIADEAAPVEESP